jgi:hypothetical protein
MKYAFRKAKCLARGSVILATNAQGGYFRLVTMARTDVAEPALIYRSSGQLCCCRPGTMAPISGPLKPD